MSWYRKYRPQTVAGLHIAPVRDAYSRILTTGEFSHAYLLSGPKGTGKTSGARILAKVLNCEKNRPQIEAFLQLEPTKPKALNEPCNLCPICNSITEGKSLCVTEIDGASNRGIDDIRDLTGRLGLSAGDGPISVVIIDEVHMLTTEAFNALLKALEEPPKHVVFILATTDVQKMPATVVSRCTTVSYRKAGSDEIVAALSQIAEKEKIKVDPGVFEAIVSTADGSFRDAVKAFESVAKGNVQITQEMVISVFGKSVREVAENLLQKLAKRDLASSAQIFKQIADEGIDLIMVQKEVLRSLHERLLSASATGNPHLPTYLTLLQQLNLAPVISSPVPALPFELACLEWCMTSPKAKVQAPKITTPEPDTDLNLRKKKEVIEEDSKTIEATIAVERHEPEPQPEIDLGPVPEFAIILSRWHEVLRGVREKNPSLEALLRTTKPEKIEAHDLTLEVYYKFHKEQLETARNFQMVSEVLTQLFSASIRPCFKLGTKAKEAAKSTESNLSGIVDLSFVKAAEDAFLS